MKARRTHLPQVLDITKMRARIISRWINKKTSSDLHREHLTAEPALFTQLQKRLHVLHAIWHWAACKDPQNIFQKKKEAKTRTSTNKYLCLIPRPLERTSLFAGYVAQASNTAEAFLKNSFFVFCSCSCCCAPSAKRQKRLKSNRQNTTLQQFVVTQQEIVGVSLLEEELLHGRLQVPADALRDLGKGWRRREAGLG